MPKSRPSPAAGSARKFKRASRQANPLTTPRRGFKADLRSAIVALKAVLRHLRKLNASREILDALHEVVRKLDRESK